MDLLVNHGCVYLSLFVEMVALRVFSLQLARRKFVIVYTFLLIKALVCSEHVGFTVNAFTQHVVHCSSYFHFRIY